MATTYEITLDAEDAITAARMLNPDFVDKTNLEYVQFVMESAAESYKNLLPK